MDESGYDICYPTDSTSGFPDELLVAIETFLLPESQLSSRSLRQGLPKPAKSERVLAVLRAIIRKRQESYETTPEQDEALLRGKLPKRRRMAIAVRRGEKWVLEHALKELNAALMVTEFDIAHLSPRVEVGQKRSTGGHSDDRSKRNKVG